MTANTTHPRKTKPEAPAPPTRFRIGTAGWTYDDWRGIFYPDPSPRRFGRLAYYARFFNLVEINSTFYHIARPSIALKWRREAARARDDFSFSLKLWRGLTHERMALDDARREIGAIKETCDILSEEKRLAALLIQFPWSFRHSEENLGYLARLLEEFRAYRQAVEIRHVSWHENGTLFDLLRERNVAFCNIDQPVLRDCPKPTSIVTSSDFAYLRLHGRNAANWFRESASGAERYDYYYDPTEVEQLARLARALAEQSSDVTVTTNNHFRGQAPADALLLRASLEGRADRLPAPLVRAFRDLRDCPAEHPPETEPGGEQLELFDLS